MLKTTFQFSLHGYPPNTSPWSQAHLCVRRLGWSVVSIRRETKGRRGCCFKLLVLGDWMWLTWSFCREMSCFESWVKSKCWGFTCCLLRVVYLLLPAVRLHFKPIAILHGNYDIPSGPNLSSLTLEPPSTLLSPLSSHLCEIIVSWITLCLSQLA